MEDAISWLERRSGALRHASDARSESEHDYARIIHAGSFRRLQGKTQILSLGDDDFYRTRLTHSLEVAQVAEGILQHLNRLVSPEFKGLLPDTALVRALGLAHDIGHPPFGHGGELALNYCMRDAGGFEGNAQTLRLLTRLEPYTVEQGADLTRRTLLGLLKYPALYRSARSSSIHPALLPTPTTIAILDPQNAKPVKACYDCEEDILEWVLTPFSASDRERFTTVEAHEGSHGRTQHKSLDCSIMDAADDIAYGIHDLEDAAALKLLQPADFRSSINSSLCEALIITLKERPIAGVQADYDGLISGLFGDTGVRKRLIGRLVHYCISATDLSADDDFEHPLLRYRVTMEQGALELLSALRDLISNKVIRVARVQHLDFKGQRMVLACFEALMTSPRQLLPENTLKTWIEGEEDPRIISDHLASLTDAGLLRLYDRLFSPRMGSIFEPV